MAVLGLAILLGRNEAGISNRGNFFCTTLYILYVPTAQLTNVKFVFHFEPYTSLLHGVFQHKLVKLNEPTAMMLTT